MHGSLCRRNLLNLEFTGILPAAGIGSRLKTVRGPKELLPIAVVVDPLTGSMRPMMVAEHSLQALRSAGVRRCVTVVNDRKPEILRYFGNGEDMGLSIAYVIQPEALGLALAVDAAFEWTTGCSVCLALPDTVFSPGDAIKTAKETLIRSDADLVLGVFPTSDPGQLGPVRIGAGGVVLEVLEKPVETDVYNTWGIAAWTPRFSLLLHELAPSLQHRSIGLAFHEAVKRGLNVLAVTFEAGSYSDLGTGEKFAAMVFGPGGEEGYVR